MFDIDNFLWNPPAPWPLEVVRPSAKVYRRLKESHWNVQYDDDLPSVTERWAAAGLLETGKIVFLIHGFQSSDEAPWVMKLKELMLEKDDWTVLTVDWRHGANLRFRRYMHAVANIHTVSQWFSGVVRQLHTARPTAYIYGVGFSLGAHVCGQVGRIFGRVSRITGVDPAGPAFEWTGSDLCLRKTDALDMVDVIHTDGYSPQRFGRWNKLTPINHHGSLLPMGTHDFYVNCGIANQPNTSSISENHTRAMVLFLWSIKHPGKFKTCQILDGKQSQGRPVTKVREVDLEMEMGYYADRNPPNPKNYMFYLATNAKPPWVPLVVPPPPPLVSIKDSTDRQKHRSD